MNDGGDIGRRLQRRLDRERRARFEAEAIAERTTSELYHRQREQLLLQEIAKAANEATGDAEAYRRVLALVCRHVGWPVGHVYNVTAEGVPESTAIWHVEPGVAGDELRLASEATAMSAGQGLPGRVLASRRPVWITDVMEDGNFPRAAHGTLGMHAAFAFPVMVGAEVVAMAEFFSADVIRPDARTLELVADVGTQLGRVAERTQTAARQLHDALHDPLTGLATRALFLDRLEHAFIRRRRFAHRRFAVMLVDIDRFKVINDSLGHDRGDELLRLLGARLATTVRGSDTVARLGGDEFAFLVEDLQDVAGGLVVADHIHQQLSAPFQLDGQDVSVSASIGIAYSEERHERAEDLLRAADMAMYRAKERGRDRHELFDRAMHDEALERLRLERLLRQAVPRRELRLQYQPIVSLRDRALLGFEALVRWHHPEMGLVSPARFIPIAEESGLITVVGRWVLEDACRQLRSWEDAFGVALPVNVSVNVSTKQFAQSSFLDDLRAVLRDSRIAPSSLKLEITESALMGQTDGASVILREIRELGVKVALDDFGTGYSSLSYLHHLPVDALKIDGSFVRAMQQGGRSAELVRTVVVLAHTLDMEAVAECVETEAQADQLMRFGCEMGQGYLFAKPLPVAEATLLLAGQRRAAALAV